MIRQIDEALAELGTNDKVILLGHNVHLHRDYKYFRFGSIKEPALDMWPSFGTHVNEKWPEAVYVIRNIISSITANTPAAISASWLMRCFSFARSRSQEHDEQKLTYYLSG